MEMKKTMDEDWRLIIGLNKIPVESLAARDLAFVRSVTLQFQERGQLSDRQWIAIQRCIDYYMPESDYDPIISKKSDFRRQPSN